MDDLTLTAVVLGTAFITGLPFARLLTCEGRLLAASPIGLGILAVSMTLLYRAGFAPRIGMFATVVACLPALVGVKVSRPWIAATAGLTVLLLLPKWIGGDSFAAFQGNRWDQFNYLTEAVGYRTLRYSDLPGGPPSVVADFSAEMLDLRPSIGVMYAGFAGLTHWTSAGGAYAFLVALQVCTFLAGAFFLTFLGCGAAASAIGGAALSIGFFAQYIFDINAWSQLAAEPIYLVIFACACWAAREDAAVTGARCIIFFATCLSGALYLYPEASVVFGGATLAALLVVGGRRLLHVGAGALCALLVATLYWRGTFGFMARQFTAASADVDWWQHFQAYLFGRSGNPLFLPVEAIAAALGLYEFLPTPQTPAATLLVLANAALIVGLIATVVVAAIRLDVRYRATLVGSAVALLVPIFFFMSGKYWTAGKSFSMAAPLLFMALSAPAFLLPGGWRVAAALFVAAHIFIGLQRPLMAAAPSILGISARAHRPFFVYENPLRLVP